MIARTWRGAVKAQDSEAYLEYLNRTGLAEYGKTPGNRGVLGLRRIAGDRAEFLLVSLWDSEEAIRRFAGEDIEKAVFYPVDEQFLIERDDHVSHYEVVHDTAPVAHG
jgi:heme-degrading monooxygenase HmoA